MSRNVVAARQAPIDPAAWTFAENGVRHLIAAGKDKTAVDRAKELHKANGTPASEALLVDAYAARIKSLTRQNLTLEAKALLSFVRERYPSSAAKLEEAAISTAARSGSFDELLAPLADPDVPVERRAAIERTVEQEVYDLSAIADSCALSSEHPLRQAASALRNAFVAVTSGPASEDVLAVPVSHRSPLASWKLLIRAIAAFHAGDDEACRRSLDAIKPESAPARLIPVLRTMLGENAASPPAGPATELIHRVTGGAAALRESLEELNEALTSGSNGRILEAIRTAMRECRTNAPELRERLQQQIAVRCAILDQDHELKTEKVAAAMGNPARQDASFLRLLALGLESTRREEYTLLACATWEQFRLLAVEEAWFPPKGLEAACLYVHMAEQIQKVPRQLIESARPSLAGALKEGRKAFLDTYFLDPEKLYQRACAIDPHAETFSPWLAWAKKQSDWQAEQVAKTWHKIVPLDLEPILFLLKNSEKNQAYYTALEYLKKAEVIDSLHTDVRNTRYRLMVGSVLNRIAKKKTDLAEPAVREIAALPEVQKGDRPITAVALHALIHLASRDSSAYEAKRKEVESALGSQAIASIFLSSLARHAGARKLLAPVTLNKVPAAERESFPTGLARIAVLLDELGVSLEVPPGYLAQAGKQLRKVVQSLDVAQLQALGKMAVSNSDLKLAYSVSAAGLGLGDASAAGFLLMRAEAVVDEDELRSTVCAAAAAQLARQVGDKAILGQAIEFLSDELDTDGPTITSDDAAAVLKAERAEPGFPRNHKDGPDYSKFVPPNPDCQCASCRRARSEAEDPFDDDYDPIDDDDIGDLPPFPPLPPGMPPELANLLIAEMLEARARGESLNDVAARLAGELVGATPRPKRKKKGKRG